jgi:MFS family permease
MAPKMQPWGMRWRSSRSFILATVGLGLFTDLILYGIGIPVLPFLLQNRLQIPNEELQLYASGLLAIYSASCVLFSVPAGWIASVVGSRQIFLAGLAFLLVSTVIFSFARDFILLASSRVLQGASGAVVWTAGLDMVQDVVPRGDMGSAIGTVSLPTIS